MARTIALDRSNRVLDARNESLAVSVPADGKRRRIKVVADALDTVLQAPGATCELVLEVNDGSGWRHYASCVFTTGAHHATDPRPHRVGLPVIPPGLITDVPPGVAVRAALIVKGQRRRMGAVIDLED